MTDNRALPDWVDGFMRFTENTEPPKLFRLWTALSIIAAALQRKCYLPWGSLTFYPNMYVVLVAPSGKARKGTAMSPGLDMLDDLGIKLAAEAITREALIRELKNSNNTIIHPQSGKTEFHASLTIFSQELTVFLGYQNRQLMSDLTDWYDCRKRWTYRTKHMGTDEIIGVWVNLIGATTPELIQTSMPLDAIGGGLTSRMIFVFEQRKGKIVPAPFYTDEELQLRRALMIDLERIHMLQGEFRASENLLDCWVDWYTSQEDNPPFEDPRFSGYFERRPGHIMKLSQILSASRSSSQIIEGKDLARSVSILNSTEVKMPYAFSGVGKSGTADVLSRVMSEVGNRGEVRFEDLMGMFYHDVDKRALETIVHTLEAMKFAKVVYQGSGKDAIIRYVKDTPYDQSLNEGDEYVGEEREGKEEGN